MTKKKLTPMLEHYLSVKEEYPDALIFYRMGDFYELFFEDAEVAARELQIALTSRDKSGDNKTPMCGVPHHAAETYLAQLVAKGFKVAVCDQVEDPKEAKGLVKREVTRVLTPGTVVEDANLSAKTNNFLAALYWDADKGRGGLTWLDYSTGSWTGMSGKRENELWQWAAKIGPRELLLPKGLVQPRQMPELSAKCTELPVRPAFDLARSEQAVLDAQGVESLTTLDLNKTPELVRACGAALYYLKQTQLRESTHLGELTLVNLSKHLIIDEVTERNLEIFRCLDGSTGRGTLWHVLDKTMTPMGGRLLHARLKTPWRDAPSIEKTQECVAFLHDNDTLRTQLRALLDKVYDLERLSTRISLGRATPKDFIALRQSVRNLPPLLTALEACPPLPADMQTLSGKWDLMEDLTALLDQALVDSPPPVITEGGLFRPGYDATLDSLIELTEHGESALAQLLAEEQTSSDIPKLKLGFNKVFGYYLELSKIHQDKVPDHFIRRQTLVNSERYITPRLKELEDKLLSASQERKDLEYKLFLTLRDLLAQARPRFMFMARALASLDYWQGLAEAARHWNWTLPALHEGLDMDIEAGRHPVVEQAMGANYIPNSLTLDNSRRILLITGPNMAGKSTVLRQVALITLLAQIGSFVPAASARIGLTDRIFSRVGASDNLAMGQSTFMVEMMETARILRQASQRSLVILDEIGRGTSTFDGLALAWAVVEELSRRARGGIRTLFATHYHELTGLEGSIPGLRNLNIAVKEFKGDIVFLRRLVPGPADKSYGIEVARLAGVPRAVVSRAKEILASLEEKSQNERRALAALQCQPTLPGLAPRQTPEQAPVPEQSQHPLLQTICELDVDVLTPLEALTLINRWKTDLGTEQ